MVTQDTMVMTQADIERSLQISWQLLELQEELAVIETVITRRRHHPQGDMRQNAMALAGCLARRSDIKRRMLNLKRDLIQVAG